MAPSSRLKIAAWGQRSPRPGVPTRAPITIEASILAPLITQAHAVLAAANGYRLDIGQVSHRERAAPERQTKRGVGVQVPGLWPWRTQGLALQTCSMHPR